MYEMGHFGKKPAEAAKPSGGNSGLVKKYVTHSLLAKLIGKDKVEGCVSSQDENR